LLLSLKLLAFAKAMHRRCGQRSAASCGDVDVMQVRLNSSVCFLLRARPVSFGYLCLHCSAAAAVSTLLVTDLRVQAIATESTLPHLLVDFQASAVASALPTILLRTANSILMIVNVRLTWERRYRVSATASQGRPCDTY